MLTPKIPNTIFKMSAEREHVYPTPLSLSIFEHHEVFLLFRDHPYITSAHFWNCSNPPFLRQNSTGRQPDPTHLSSPFADVICIGMVPPCMVVHTS